MCANAFENYVKFYAWVNFVSTNSKSGSVRMLFTVIFSFLYCYVRHRSMTVPRKFFDRSVTVPSPYWAKKSQIKITVTITITINVTVTFNKLLISQNIMVGNKNVFLHWNQHKMLSKRIFDRHNLK